MVEICARCGKKIKKGKEAWNNCKPFHPTCFMRKSKRSPDDMKRYYLQWLREPIIGKREPSKRETLKRVDELWQKKS
jgi:hypothetical protein